jgi:1-deoxy-D-xylulose 5-phosphate reductoisomerase
VEKSLNESLKSYIQHTRKSITRNTIFSASRETTVSSFISKECKIPTIQIEINKELRDKDNLKNLSLLINSLEKVIEKLSKIF